MPVAVPKTSEEEARQQLITHFRDAVADHPDVMTECLSLLRIYSLTAETLYYKYEAFVLARPSGLRVKMETLSMESLKEFREQIKRDQTAAHIAAQGAAASADGGNVGGSSRKAKAGVGLDLGGLLGGMSTPVKSALSPAQNGSSSRRLSGGYDTATPKNKYDTPVASGSQYRPGNRGVGDHAGGMLLDTPMGRSGTNSGRSSPVSGNESPGPASAQPFRSRAQPHTLIESLNPHLPGSSDIPIPPISKPRTKLSTTAAPEDFAYRYMFEKISERSASLDDQIDDFGEIIKDAYGLSELGDPHMATDDSIYTVGRILAPPTDTNKASVQSLYLESSRMLGSGKRIALRFVPGQTKVRGGSPGVQSFGVFPGALVGLKGRNGGGGFFAVDEVLLPQPSPLPVSTAAELLEQQHGAKLQGGPVSVHIAAGPFTFDTDLSFEPLQALLEVVEQERPDVLVLLGPFIDASHPIIASGAITRSPADIFKSEITARLLRTGEVSPNTYILLVPSVKDIVSTHMAYPQAMLDKETLGLPKSRVKVMPNPCSFSINETLFSLSTVDVLFHLRREEVVQRALEAEPQQLSPSAAAAAAVEAKDTMANLVRHVLGQRSFYPIFPPPEHSAAELNLDVTHFDKLRMEQAPDVLVLPSRLKHFAKIVDSSLVINPGYLSKARTAGTFAKIIIHPKDKGELEKRSMEEEQVEEHEVYNRARAETWRI